MSAQESHWTSTNIFEVFRARLATLTQKMQTESLVSATMELKIASKSDHWTDPYFTIQKLHHDGTNPILVRKRYVVYLGMRYEAKKRPVKENYEN